MERYEPKNDKFTKRRNFIRFVAIAAGSALAYKACSVLFSHEMPTISGELVFDKPEVIDGFWKEKGFPLTQEGLAKKDISSFTAQISAGQLKKDADFVFYKSSESGVFLVKNKDSQWENLLPTINANQDIQLVDTRSEVNKRYPVFGWNADGAKEGKANPYFVTNDYLFGDFLPGIDQSIEIPLLVSGTDSFDKMGGLVIPEVGPLRPAKETINEIR